MSDEKQHWGNNEPGILRKAHTTDSELLIFGYSCKLFRDDEKALQIDQGKHLIPWMGDDSLKIDRYDVRGALSDISKYEGSKNGADNSWDSLSSEERKVEILCDNERYRALIHNEDEEALYQEEELKRLHQALGADKAYGQVSYEYEKKETHRSVCLTDDENTSDDQHEPFVPPVQLDIPPNMTIPDTKKQNAIIEKTALFICQQGPQMEILLKMKQANNPQFQFLSISCPLHSYYRHVLAVIKAGRYKPTLPDDCENKESDDEDNYLHPSLLQGSSLESAPYIPTIAYKPSADCAYSMLVNKIKSKQEGISAELYTTSGLHEEKVEICRAPIKYKPQLPDSMESGYNVATKMISKSSKRKRRKRSFSKDLPGQKSSNGLLSPYANSDGINYYDPENTSLMSLYDPDMIIEEPPDELKSIINKMATYVLRNGRTFEAIVRSKGDPRFSFLEPIHMYNPYYNKLLQNNERLNNSHTLSTTLPTSPSFSEENVNSAFNGTNDFNLKSSSRTFSKDNTFLSIPRSSYYNNSHLFNEDTDEFGSKVTAESSDGESYSPNKPISVCFSIKKPKDSDKLELCSALPMEESSDNEPEKEEEFLKIQPPKVYDKAPDKPEKTSKSRSSRHKSADDKLRDKLTLAAKEKLAKKEKEKQLQLERKKRALAFLNRIQKDPNLLSRKNNDIALGQDGRASSVQSVISVSTDDSAQRDHRSLESSNKALKDKAAHTLKRMLEVSTKERIKDKKSRRSSPSRNRNHSKSKKEKHRHHKSHKNHKRRSKDKDDHKSSHKHKHKSKSSKNHKERRKSASVVTISSE